MLLQPTELLNTIAAGNEAYIQQIGSNNELDLLQQQEGLERNFARVLQHGDWNVAIIAQTDEGNRLALIQEGSSNLYKLAGNGAFNELVNIQQGEGNRIMQEFQNSTSISAEFVQIGNFNEILHQLENIQGQSFSVRQIGDGLKVIIRQSN